MFFTISLPPVDKLYFLNIIKKNITTMEDKAKVESVINKLIDSIPKSFKKFKNSNCSGGQNWTIYHPSNTRDEKVRSLFISTCSEKIRMEVTMKKDEKELEFTFSEFLFNSQDLQGFPYDLINLWVEED